MPTFARHASQRKEIPRRGAARGTSPRGRTRPPPLRSRPRSTRAPTRYRRDGTGRDGREGSEGSGAAHPRSAGPARRRSGSRGRTTLPPLPARSGAGRSAAPDGRWRCRGQSRGRGRVPPGPPPCALLRRAVERSGPAARLCPPSPGHGCVREARRRARRSSARYK